MIRKNIPSDLEIRNIHTNTAHPGVIYAELFRGDEIICSATLDYCNARAKGIINNEEFDVMENYAKF